MPETELDQFFAGHPFARAVHDRVAELIASIGPVERRVSRSQVVFRRRRGFAYLWIPGQYLANPAADVVLSLALPERIDSGRWKEVVHPAPGTWMHHLEVRSLVELDRTVLGWLTVAFDAAGTTPDAAPGTARGR
jgi:hypothetical protein